MKKIPLILSIILIAILQAAVLNHIKLFGAKPDILLITVVFFALRFGKKIGFWTGLVCGLLQDALSGMPFGTQTLTFSLCGFIIGAFNKAVFGDRKSVQITVVFIFCIISYMSYYYMLKNKFHVVSLDMPFFKILIGCLYTSFISPLIFPILNKKAISWTKQSYEV